MPVIRDLIPFSHAPSFVRVTRCRGGAHSGLGRSSGPPPARAPPAPTPPTRYSPVLLPGCRRSERHDARQARGCLRDTFPAHFQSWAGNAFSTGARKPLEGSPPDARCDLLGRVSLGVF